jgi:hypothetical protein
LWRTSDSLACIPHVIEPHWDNVWAPRLAGFPVNIVYAARIEGIGLAEARYVFDPGTFIEGEQTRQMRCRPTIESEFSVLVALRPEGGIETFKYRASELICEARGPDFQTAMIHASPGGKQSTSPVRPRLAPRAWRTKTTYRARRHNLHRSRWKALAHGSRLFGEFTEARRSRNIYGNPA